MKQFCRVGYFFLKVTTAFRMNFWLMILRQFIALAGIFIFWYSLVSYGITIRNYSGTQLITYFIYTFLIGQLVLSTKLFAIGDSIISGEFSRILLYPISLFKIFLSWDMVDKLFNFIILLIYSLPFFVWLPAINIDLSLDQVLIFISFLALAFFMFSILVMIINSIAFFVSEMWSLQFLFYILVSFFSGQYFPLDIAGKWLTLNPLAYIIYWPTRILVASQAPPISLWLAGFIGLGWLAVLYLVFKKFWRFGLSRFAGWGG